MSKVPQRPGCTTLKPFVSGHLYRKISLDQVWGYVNNFQKSEKIQVQANFIPKDKRYRQAIQQAPFYIKMIDMQLTFYVANLITIKLLVTHTNMATLWQLIVEKKRSTVLLKFLYSLFTVFSFIEFLEFVTTNKEIFSWKVVHCILRHLKYQKLS
jgi:hypothetical protein